MATPTIDQGRVMPALLAGPGYALLALCIAAVIASVLLSATGLQENSLESWMYPIHGLSALLGGMKASRRSGTKGWYYGGLTGILYALIILLSGFLAFDASLGSHTAIVSAVSAAAGALGGMFGVNISKK